LPVDSVLLGHDGFAIRNTASVLANAPHPEAAKKLVNFLESPTVLIDLRKAGAIEPTDAPSNSSVNWNDLLANQTQNLEFLKGLFLR
jgi:ABC-type Fe3+ transport system substrate-binding protein